MKRINELALAVNPNVINIGDLQKSIKEDIEMYRKTENFPDLEAYLKYKFMVD